MLCIDANVWVAAFDPHDRFHDASTEFLRAAALQGAVFCGPAFVTVETACALARRCADKELGQRVYGELRANPRLSLEPLTKELIEVATILGTELGLRGADALYAAASKRAGTILISWDNELVQRANAVTPEEWLKKQM